MSKLTGIVLRYQWSVMVLIACFTLSAGAAEFPEDTVEKIRDALQDADRLPEDRERDANRKPIDTLMFFELSDDMRVLELFPGRGWYTRILASVLAESGQLYTALGTSGVREPSQALEGLEVVETFVRLRPTGTYGIYDLDEVEFGLNDLDLVVTFRNLHNLTEDARANLLAAAFKALRPGGRLGIVDHTRRHMEPDGLENRRRMDPIQIVLEATNAGFLLKAYSDLHYRSDDELEYEVGAHSVAGNTDRFTFLFVRP